MRKLVAIISILLISLILTSCEKSQPEYLIYAGFDNGYKEEYRASYQISDNSVSVISKKRYKELTQGDDCEYESVTIKFYLFDVNAKTEDPEEWEFAQKENDDEEYDTEKLVAYLNKMDLAYTGDVDIKITEFDDYTVLDVINKSYLYTKDRAFGLFKNDEMIPFSNKIEFEKIRYIYKHKQM